MFLSSKLILAAVMLQCITAASGHQVGRPPLPPDEINKLEDAKRASFQA